MSKEKWTLSDFCCMELEKQYRVEGKLVGNIQVFCADDNGG